MFPVNHALLQVRANTRAVSPLVSHNRNNSGEIGNAPTYSHPGKRNNLETQPIDTTLDLKFDDLSNIHSESNYKGRTSCMISGDETCSHHVGKKIEIFCDACKELLCIDCILTQKHKNHDMLSFQKGSEKERERFKALCESTIPRKNELEHKILTVKTHLQELEKKAGS